MKWLTGTTKHNIKIQTVDADRRIVLDAKLDVPLDAEAEVDGTAEVILMPKLVLLHLFANDVEVD
jgi:hypothetical protein